MASEVTGVYGSFCEFLYYGIVVHRYVITAGTYVNVDESVYEYCNAASIYELSIHMV